MFISFEGGEGVGKTTQIALLKGALTVAGHTVITTREPGGTNFGRTLRELILHGEEISPAVEAMLFAADRGHHVDTLIRPALERGETVITDRYLDSSVVYQGFARKVLEPDFIERLSVAATGGLYPDVTVLLDADPHDPIIKARLQARDGGPDRIESAGGDFHTLVRQGFLDRAKRLPDRFIVIDAARPVTDVHNDILATFGNRGPRSAMTMDHRCDTGNFDRSICPPPCGTMHSYCSTCGARQDVCAHECPAPNPLLDAGDADLIAELVRRNILTPEPHCATALAIQADGDYSVYTCQDTGSTCPPDRYVTS